MRVLWCFGRVWVGVRAVALHVVCPCGCPCGRCVGRLLFFVPWFLFFRVFLGFLAWCWLVSLGCFSFVCRLGWWHLFCLLSWFPWLLFRLCRLAWLFGAGWCRSAALLLRGVPRPRAVGRPPLRAFVAEYRVVCVSVFVLVRRARGSGVVPGRGGCAMPCASEGREGGSPCPYPSSPAFRVDPVSLALPSGADGSPYPCRPGGRRPSPSVPLVRRAHAAPGRLPARPGRPGAAP